MNDLNKITEVDLNPELRQKINENKSNMESITLQVSNWIESNTASSSDFHLPDSIRYKYIASLPVNESSLVNVSFTGLSKELALDCGMYDAVEVVDEYIVFYAEELPSNDLTAVVHYII